MQASVFIEADASHAFDEIGLDETMMGVGEPGLPADIERRMRPGRLR